MQLLCPASSWYVYNPCIEHALQVAAPPAEKKPAGHGAHAVWPSRDWERPAPHATQCAADDVGCVPLTRPAAHAVHDACAGAEFHELGAHTAHVGALFAAEKRPGAHGAHRAGDGSLTLATNVPGAHGCFVSQKGWPPRAWYLPEGQCPQSAALITLENVPGAHGAQTRSAVALGAKSSRSPGMQRAALVKGVCWLSMQEESTGQGSHFPVCALPMVPGAHLVSHTSCPGWSCHRPHGQA